MHDDDMLAASRDNFLTVRLGQVSFHRKARFLLQKTNAGWMIGRARKGGCDVLLWDVFYTGHLLGRSWSEREDVCAKVSLR